MAYQFKGRVRYSEVGEDGKLTLPGVIDYFQDCSTFQSEELKVGLDVMEKKKKAWILAYWHIVLKRLPRMGETVTSETWPYRFNGFYGERNFRLLDEEDHALAYANSMWIYLDVESGRPCRVDEEIKESYLPEMEEPLPMEKTSRKIPVPMGSVEMEHLYVGKSHLDTNHHVNNGQYILMAQEYLPAEFEAGEIRVEYKKSAVLHDEIVPMVYREGAFCTVSLCDTQKKPYAVIEFKAAPR